ncbi:response regulator [Candidatus Woesearchaeota archaeon]|nr:response regulator [Candidatus Woesearchaeota archaeon]
MAKIIVVDDSNLIAAVISHFAKGYDCEILTARDGEEAIERYKSEKPDLVFLDIKMPKMNGIQALEEIRKIDPEAKVVMCTALKEKAQEEKAKALGACGYITKPFTKEDITSILKKYLK